MEAHRGGEQMHRTKCVQLTAGEDTETAAIKTRHMFSRCGAPQAANSDDFVMVEEPPWKSPCAVAVEKAGAVEDPKSHGPP